MPFGRYVAEWTGFSGAPGYSTFHFDAPGTTGEAQGAAAAIRNFFVALASRWPTGISVGFDSEITIHADDGTLTATWGISPVPVTVPGAGGGNWAAPTGMRVNWETGVVLNGKRLRGATFIVPLIVSQYDAVGTLAATTVSGVATTAQQLITDLGTNNTPLFVWSPTGATTGLVTSVSIPDRAAVLRSRRD